MLRLFKCWNVDDGGEEAGMDFLVESASKAAEWFAKMRDRESGDGYSEEQTVIVKDMEVQGEPMRFDVRAGDEVVYRAKRFEQDKDHVCGDVSPNDIHGRRPCVLRAGHDGHHMDKTDSCWGFDAPKG